MIFPALSLLIAYLLGSIPTSITAARLVRGIDIRRHGSGNAGASNVLRVIGWKVALPVLVVDLAKGALAVLVARELPGGPLEERWVEVLVGMSAVAGHVWPVFARFRGGKGVATTGGVWLVVAPPVLLVAFLVFVAVLGLTRWIALASISAACSLPLALWLSRIAGLGELNAPLLTLALAGGALTVVLHRANITRLLQGTEPKIGRTAV